MFKSHYIAFDLGATSGRTILGTIEDKMLTIQELNRFPNQLLELHGRYYWNIFSIYEYLKEGLQLCVSMGIKPASIELMHGALILLQLQKTVPFLAYLVPIEILVRRIN